MEFPGLVALFPVLGTVAIILAGSGGTMPPGGKPDTGVTSRCCSWQHRLFAVPVALAATRHPATARRARTAAAARESCPGSRRHRAGNSDLLLRREALPGPERRPPQTHDLHCRARYDGGAGRRLRRLGPCAAAIPAVRPGVKQADHRRGPRRHRAGAVRRLLVDASGRWVPQAKLTPSLDIVDKDLTDIFTNGCNNNGADYSTARYASLARSTRPGPSCSSATPTPGTGSLR